MPTDTPQDMILRVADLSQTSATRFDLQPDADECARIAGDLGLQGLKKLRFKGQISPAGKRDWELRADLGATVVQECVITLAPVTTRIDTVITRLYLADLPAALGNEEEMPEDDTQEQLPEHLDLPLILSEALALNLPLYPRAEGAALEQANFAAPGVAPMTDEDARPFAGLAALKDQLEPKS